MQHRPSRMGGRANRMSPRRRGELEENMAHFTKLSTTVLAATIVVWASNAHAFPNYTCDYDDEVLEAWDIDGDGVLSQDDAECLQEVILWSMGGAGSAVPECLAMTVREVDFNRDRQIGVVDLLSFGRAIDYYGECTLYADINGSGVFNSADAQCMALAVSSMQQGPGTPLPGCVASDEMVDLDCDGEFDLIDFMIFLHVLEGGLHPDIDGNDNGIHDSCE